MPVKKVEKVANELDRLKQFANRMVQSDINRPLVPHNEHHVYENPTVGDCQASLRGRGVFTPNDDRFFRGKLCEPLLVCC